MRLSGKVAVITGAAGDIGLTTASRFVAEGAAVVLADLRAEALEEARAQLSATVSGAVLATAIVDVTDAGQVAAMVAGALKRFGRIDCLVNNAGITSDARLVTMTDEQFDRVIAVNLKGVYRCTQAVADPMIRQGSGVIINASSVVGLYGNFGQTNYAATKAGVIGFTKTWARELGPKGIRVVAVCPGFIRTPHGLREVAELTRLGVDASEAALAAQQGRIGEPEEVAQAALFLASDESSFVTGTHLFVDNGFTAA